ncbi:hypothetical protein H9L15_07270 [Sphingomonas daechungensis]|uniref:Tetratricopeptide repeat protein n=1 Tax=Sphingomonas daechungensis TaxID=1176646 RepID=A0ABX6T353_9SPHN|nr:hypothetical protein [Sphingomonas daechungensis]QNP44252.1 hypothetical protein H9L15_07270 [Sphingomonas daechungensis]
MSQTAAMAANLSTSFNADTLADLAGKALEEGEEEQALPYLERGAKHFASPLLWQWKALLERSLDEHEAALASFEQAARQAPGDVSIAHGHARTAMEAGLDARPIYARALALAPRNGQIMVGAAAARVAMGEGERAIEDLMATLRGAPAWIYGHEQLAQIMATQGRASEATASLDQALASFPKAQPLWEALLNVQLRRGAYETLLPIVAKARSAGVDSPEFAIYEGIHAAEFEQDVRPPALFGAFPEAVDRALGRWRVRHLLRAGAIDALIPLIHEEMQRDRTAELWAYAATAWRLAGDPRSQWLEEDERLVSVADITADLPRSTSSLRRFVRCTSPEENIWTSPFGAGRRPTVRCSAGSIPRSVTCAGPLSVRWSVTSRSFQALTRAIQCSVPDATAGSGSREAGRCGFARMGIIPITSTR